MIVLAFALSYAGFTALCLSLSRHYREVFDATPSQARTQLLRALGWAALALAFAVAIAASGWQVGAVLWIALLTAAAASNVLMLSYAPRRLMALGAGLLPVGLLAALLTS